MTIPQWLQYTLTIFVGAAAVSALAGIAFAQFKKGTRTESGDIVKFYKEQADNYKVIADTTRKEYTEKHEELLKEVGVLRGEVNTERSLRQQYEAILKDRNPETEEFMKFMIQTSKDQAAANKEIVRVLAEIHAMAKAEHDRDFKVEATVTKA